MPMSVQSAEQQIAVLSSFIASYENYIQGKINDPVIFMKIMTKLTLMI